MEECCRNRNADEEIVAHKRLSAEVIAVVTRDRHMPPPRKAEPERFHSRMVVWGWDLTLCTPPRNPGVFLHQLWAEAIPEAAGELGAVPHWVYSDACTPDDWMYHVDTVQRAVNGREYPGVLHQLRIWHQAYCVANIEHFVWKDARWVEGYLWMSPSDLAAQNISKGEALEDMEQEIGRLNDWFEGRVYRLTLDRPGDRSSGYVETRENIYPGENDSWCPAPAILDAALLDCDLSRNERASVADVEWHMSDVI